MANNRDIKKILFISVLIVSISCVFNTIQRHQWHIIPQWDENSDLDTIDSNDQDKIFDECNSNTEGNCDSKKERDEIKMVETNLFPLKRKSSTEYPLLNNFDKLLQMERKSDIVPYFHTSQPVPCSCGSHYRLLDLGLAYYPRYLPAAVCDGGTCGIYRCRQRLYKVRVLKRRDANAPDTSPLDINHTPLPESLRKNWMFETFTVTVACECGL